MTFIVQYANRITFQKASFKTNARLHFRRQNRTVVHHVTHAAQEQRRSPCVCRVQQKLLVVGKLSYALNASDNCNKMS